ncbi:polyprenyl diphosphate synthase [Saccharopolyspora shandongensis]|uniref:polyprenyl diphosphate synthase n=1 Tax=Saccharopolyspora shandongensis TaxID=418495 RepID=UPI00340D54AB
MTAEDADGASPGGVGDQGTGLRGLGMVAPPDRAFNARQWDALRAATSTEIDMTSVPECIPLDLLPHVVGQRRDASTTLRPVHSGSASPSRVPRHVAIVMDGNRRWARANGKSEVYEGHRAGFDKIPMVLGWCEEFGIGVVTLWMLSDDNIRTRSQRELVDLYAIDADVVDRLVAARRWRLHAIGSLGLLPTGLADRLRRAERQTADVGGMLVNLAIAYGGRQDVVGAVRALVADVESGKPVRVTEEVLASYLSTAGLPDPDLVIRPSGEIRTSGFMMWQAAYAELYFCAPLWPDFARTDLEAALRAYSNRHRRFGA